MSKPLIYVIGSLRNPQIPLVANSLEDAGYNVFADWYGGGERADDSWQSYEKIRGKSYREALDGPVARCCYIVDYTHLKKCDAAVLVAPGGKSAHIELGWVIGQGKPGFVLFDNEPERWDVMLQFCFTTDGDVCFGMDELLEALAERFSEPPPVKGYLTE